MRARRWRDALVRLKLTFKFTLHACRSTASTWLRNHGFQRDWIECKLAHMPRGNETAWGVFDIFHQDNARLLQSHIKDKKRHEVQRYHAILLEAWRGKVPFSAFKRVVVDGFKEYRQTAC